MASSNRFLCAFHCRCHASEPVSFLHCSLNVRHGLCSDVGECMCVSLAIHATSLAHAVIVVERLSDKRIRLPAHLHFTFDWLVDGWPRHQIALITNSLSNFILWPTRIRPKWRINSSTCLSSFKQFVVF